MTLTEERKAGIILALIAGAEGLWVFINLQHGPLRFFRYAGFLSLGDVGAAGWMLAILFTAVFVAFSARLPSVRANLLRPSGLKILALAVAIAAGFCEELVF